MPHAILAPKRIQDQQDASLGALGAGVDGYVVYYDHATTSFKLKALVSDHGGLTGLGDDDHTQYVLADGSRTGASSSVQVFTTGVTVSDLTSTRVVYAGASGRLSGDAALTYASGSLASTRYLCGTSPAISREGNTGNVWIGVTKPSGLTTGYSNMVMGDGSSGAVIPGKSLTSGFGNLIIGTDCGYNVAGGYSNVLMAFHAGASITSGAGNIAIGPESCYLANPNQATCVGAFSGYQLLTGYGVYIGNRSGYTQQYGFHCTAVGDYALYSNSAGSDNTALGWEAGYYQVGNRGVFIGYQAGKNVALTGDDLLVIANSTTATPLIHGNFATPALTVNGSLVVNEQGGDLDTRIEGDTDANLVFVDASADSVGIGTTGPGRKVEINDASGNCLRLTYNDSNGSAANYADLTVSSSGDLAITPSGGDTLNVDANLVLPKTSGKGIKVDTATPTYPWADLIGEVTDRVGGAAAPTWAAYRGNVYAYQFSNASTREAQLVFHVPHDYAPGTDLYIHAHWSQIVVDSGGPAGVPGDVRWQFDVTYAKGHDQAAFPAPITLGVTQTASGTQYRHMIAEVQLSAASPTASQLDSDDIEVDGLLLVRVFRDPGAAADTLNQAPFLHTVDIHYQSTGIGTKNKAPNFWS